ncbi:MAG: TOBE domain-containing protein, partial [Mesorhizobium sp.]
EGGSARFSSLGTTFKLALQAFSDALPAEVELGIRPDDLHWTKDAPSRCSQKITGTVASIETTGSETFVLVNVAGTEINSRFPSFAPVRIGDQVDLVFDPRDLHFFDSISGANLCSPQKELLSAAEPARSVG